MPAFRDLPESTGLHAADVIGFDNLTDAVTQKHRADTLLAELAQISASSPMGPLEALARYSPNPAHHRTVYGGRSLGTSITEEMLANIRNGSFMGMLVGDYVTLDGNTFYIVDMDYWHREGLAAHHIVVMPGINMDNVIMDDTGAANVTYYNSKLRTETLPTVLNTLDGLFPGNIILEHLESLPTKTEEGVESASIIVSTRVELPSEVMMFGHSTMSATAKNHEVLSNGTYSKTQLALFMLHPESLLSNGTFWMRDDVASGYFSILWTEGLTGAASANTKRGVRPVFAVG